MNYCQFGILWRPKSYSDLFVANCNRKWYNFFTTFFILISVIWSKSLWTRSHHLVLPEMMDRVVKVIPFYSSFCPQHNYHCLQQLFRNCFNWSLLWKDIKRALVKEVGMLWPHLVVSLDQDVNGVENSRAEELKKSNLNKTMALVFLSPFPLFYCLWLFEWTEEGGKIKRDYIGKWK